MRTRSGEKNAQRDRRRHTAAVKWGGERRNNTKYTTTRPVDN